MTSSFAAIVFAMLVGCGEKCPSCASDNEEPAPRCECPGGDVCCDACPCPGLLACCDGMCANTDASEGNCGTCDHACPATDACDVGTCEPATCKCDCDCDCGSFTSTLDVEARGGACGDDDAECLRYCSELCPDDPTVSATGHCTESF